ncbi:flagellar hook-length control protein FliK [Zhongshania sp.]|uniref:flagellar hook-length control protein FliK n=1 Tax=Zhongshania sp. TaxID=1971902 RepID=UPI001B46B6EB|nr:flagellar hook-length control protein FliK [Zhongshania sp.]MBQ0797227.1 flagellar hook-length control protein FliK [Zhongshania sp.]
MQNSISLASPKMDGSAKAGVQNSPVNSGSAGGRGVGETPAATPFNLLLSTAQGAVPGDDFISGEASQVDGGDQLSGDIDIFSDSLADIGFSGKMVPKSGTELPVTDLESLDNTDTQLLSEEGEVLVTWQQSQIDWSRQATARGTNNAGATNVVASVAGLSLDASEGQLADDNELAETILAKSEKFADGKASTNSLPNTVSDLAKPTTGFANAMQLSSAASAAPQVKSALQSVDLNTESSSGLELSAAPQSRSAESSAARAPVALSLSQNALTDPAWSQAMSAKISWMAGNGVHTATMQLHPAELGSIHIQLSVQGDTTSVQIQAQNRDTSELMEKMMPRLHSGMENQGLRLEEVKVSHNPNLNDNSAGNNGQQFAGQSAGDRSGAANGRGNGGDAGSSQQGLNGEDNGVSSGELNAEVILQNSGVDYYA